jgi:mannose-1-phosphate guanylyltransferase/phosphomannomutase
MVELEGWSSKLEGGTWIPDSSTVEGQVLMEPPIFLGENCTVEREVRLTGPVVIGDACTLGAGATLREVVVWPGTEVSPGAMIIGGITGLSPLWERIP